LPQIEIDPARAKGDSRGDARIPILPPATRGFGFVPNLSQLMPGDLILSRSTSPGFIDSRIAAAQTSGGFSPSDARWTHAAVFVYDDQIVEALPFKGIVQQSIYGYVPTEIMRVRRKPDLSDGDRLKIAFYAMKNLGRRYGHGDALAVGIDLAKGLWSKGALTTNRFIVICSQLYFDAILEVTHRRLANCPTESPTTPAHLSATTDLLDTSVDWHRVTE
jgi:hypothetical protein